MTWLIAVSACCLPAVRPCGGRRRAQKVRQRQYQRAVRNAVTVTGAAKKPKEATASVAFRLTAAGGRRILLDTGQPPVTPAILKGNIAVEVKN